MTDAENAFSVVRDAAAQFSGGTTGLPAEKKIIETTKLIGFRVIGQDCVIRLNEISEVLTPEAYTKLPRVKRWVKGVSNVRGRLLPVVDFAAFLGGTITGRPREQRILVIELRGVSTNAAKRIAADRWSPILRVAIRTKSVVWRCSVR